MSYADFLDYWIDTYASFNLHYSTTVSYINIIKNHVKPRIGFYKLFQLDTRLLQEFINKIYVEYSFSKNYMASILKVVKGSLKYACYTGARIDIRTRKFTHCDIILSNVKRRCPMARTYKTYDEDYKKNIVKLVENGKAVSDIEREYGINRKLIYNWKNKYGTIKTSTGEVTTNDEILKLKKELNDIKIENEILKKAVAIFTKK